jgi:hypothetical protein
VTIKAAKQDKPVKVERISLVKATSKKAAYFKGFNGKMEIWVGDSWKSVTRNMSAAEFNELFAENDLSPEGGQYSFDIRVNGKRGFASEVKSFTVSESEYDAALATDENET